MIHISDHRGQWKEKAFWACGVRFIRLSPLLFPTPDDGVAYHYDEHNDGKSAEAPLSLSVNAHGGTANDAQRPRTLELFIWHFGISTRVCTLYGGCYRK